MIIKMEEKIRIEEEVRKALFRSGGDVLAVSGELNLPYEYVIKIRQKMQRDLMKNPDANLQIASNITREIIKGRRRRNQIRQDMINSLSNREQMWICPGCRNEVRTTDTSAIYHCITCNKDVNLKFLDREKIYALKQSILRDEQAEDDSLIEWLVKMGFTANQPSTQPTTVIQNKQQFLVIESDKTKKIIEEIKHLPALEAEKLRQDLKKEIINLDDKIREAEKEESGTEGP
jgi:hypothetical protein